MKKVLVHILFVLIVAFFLYPLKAESWWRRACTVVQDICGRKVKSNVSIPIKPKVAVIEASSLNLKKMCNKLVYVAKNTEVLGIVFLIDSLGGPTADYSVFHDLIKEITSRKPVVALVISNALSGGYLIASGANHIIAHNGSSIGGIGVIFEIRRDCDVQVKTDKLRAKSNFEVFKAGKFKALGHPYVNGFSDDERTYLQEKIERYYQFFISVVATDRNLDVNTSEEWAEGKEFLADEALKLGLIDEIGTYFDAEKKIVDLIKQADPHTNYDTEIEPIYYGE